MEWVWGIFKSTINYALKFIYSVSAIKAVVFTAAFWLFKTLWDYALGLMDSVDLGAIATSLSGLNSDLMYFLLLFRVDFGVPAIIAAYLVRFTIRRLPVIG